jgi:hypothetical protein
MLPSIAPQARIMRYGYESQWFGDNSSSTVRLRASTIAGLDVTDPESYVNWLSDPAMLPKVVPNARIMRYGYKSQWFGPNAIKQNSSRVAHRLLIALKRARKVKQRNSPHYYHRC